MRSTAFRIIVGALAGFLVASCGGGGEPSQSLLATAQHAKSVAPDLALLAEPATQVNTTTDGSQVLRTVGSTSDGGYTVAWLSGTSTLSLQHYDSDGVREAGETPVPVAADSIAVLTDGSVLAAYAKQVSTPEPGQSVSAIYIQRVDTSGAPASQETELDRSALPICGWRCMRDVSSPRVQALADGGFIVSWIVTGYDLRFGAIGTVSLQRFDMQSQSSGAFLVGGGPFLTYGIAPDARGGFIVTVSYDNPYTTRRTTINTHYDAAMHPQSLLSTGLLLALDDVYVRFAESASGATRQLLDSAGLPIGDATALSSVPFMARELSDGSYVLVWRDGTDFLAQRFTVDGGTIGESFAIRTGAGSFLMASLAEPGFVLAWTAYGANGDADVYAQRFVEAPNGVKKACLAAAKAHKLKGKERKTFMNACLG